MREGQHILVGISVIYLFIKIFSIVSKWTTKCYETVFCHAENEKMFFFWETFSLMIKVTKNIRELQKIVTLSTELSQQFYESKQHK